MQKILTLKPIFVTTVSLQKQKHIRAHRLSDFPRHSLQQLFSTSLGNVLSINEEEMSIPVSDALRSWLERKNLKGFLKVAEAEPHPSAQALMEEINVSKITYKKVREVLRMPRGGFDAVKKVSEEGFAPTSENTRPPPKRIKHKEVGMSFFM